MPRGGQVHRAVLWDGREVAVKVQYLGLETAVSADLACLGALAAAAARLFPAAPDLRWVLAELRSNLAQELDFRRALELCMAPLSRPQPTWCLVGTPCGVHVPARSMPLGVLLNFCHGL